MMNLQGDRKGLPFFYMLHTAMKHMFGGSEGRIESQLSRSVVEGLYLNQKGAPPGGSCFLMQTPLLESKLSPRGKDGGRIASLKLAIR